MQPSTPSSPSPSLSGTYARTLEDLRAFILADPGNALQKLLYDPLGRTLWERPASVPLSSPSQADIVSAPFKFRKSAWGTGHGVSKTESTSCIILLWMLSHYPCYVIVNSAGWTNIESRIFPALRAKVEVFNKLDPEFKLPVPLSTNWVLGDEWEVVSISPDRPEVAQGWHSSGGTLVLVDEASYVGNQMFESFMSVIKSPRDAIMLFGNPTRAEGIFADILRSSGEGVYADWHVGTINSEYTPNYQATLEAIRRGEMTEDQARGRGQWRGNPQEIVRVPGLVTYSYCRRIEEQYGRESSVFSGRVLGTPPDQSEDTLIAISTIKRAGEIPLKPASEDPPLRLCVDVAFSETGDRTVFAACSEGGVRELTQKRGWSEPRIVGQVVRMLQENPSIQEVRIDRTGVGSGPFSTLQTMQERGEIQARIIGVVNAGSPSNKAEYANIRAESWGEMNSALKAGAFSLSVCANEMMEATGVTYAPTLKGQIQLEDKKKFKSRMGYSPDVADCIAMNFTVVTGNSVFSSVTSVHKLLLQPHLENANGKFLLWLGDRKYQAREGILLRSFAYSRRGKWALLWIHADPEGCWTILDSIRGMGQTAPLGKIASLAVQRETLLARGVRFVFDVCTAQEEQPGFIDLWHSALLREAKELGIRPSGFPEFIQPVKLAGAIGMDALDQMLLGTMARMPKHEFWLDRVDRPEDYLRGPMLVSWDQSVLDDLARASFRERDRAYWNEDERKPEDAIGGGGPGTLALRLLVAAGAAMR